MRKPARYTNGRTGRLAAPSSGCTPVLRPCAHGREMTESPLAVFSPWKSCVLLRPQRLRPSNRKCARLCIKQVSAIVRLQIPIGNWADWAGSGRWEQAAGRSRARFLDERGDSRLDWVALRHNETDRMENVGLDDWNGTQCIGRLDGFERRIGDDAGPTADADISHQRRQRIRFK